MLTPFNKISPQKVPNFVPFFHLVDCGMLPYVTVMGQKPGVPIGCGYLNLDSVAHK
jgi:hypothetical protein